MAEFLDYFPLPLQKKKYKGKTYTILIYCNIDFNLNPGFRLY
jgi:hypothetical protein